MKVLFVDHSIRLLIFGNVLLLLQHMVYNFRCPYSRFTFASHWRRWYKLFWAVVHLISGFGTSISLWQNFKRKSCTALSFAVKFHFLYSGKALHILLPQTGRPTLGITFTLDSKLLKSLHLDLILGSSNTFPLALEITHMRTTTHALLKSWSHLTSGSWNHIPNLSPGPWNHSSTWLRAVEVDFTLDAWSLKSHSHLTQVLKKNHNRLQALRVTGTIALALEIKFTLNSWLLQ